MSLQLILILDFLAMFVFGLWFLFSGQNLFSKAVGLIFTVLGLFTILGYLSMVFPSINWF